MSYTDFDFYQNNYNGTLINTEKSFISLELKASAYIDMITSGKIDFSISDDTQKEKIQSAVCAVCDILAGFPEDNIISENNDGYSVTYNKDFSARKSLLYNAARTYLPLSLLYRGIYGGYDE